MNTTSKLSSKPIKPATPNGLSDVELERQLSELSSFANSAAVNGVAMPPELEAQFLELQTELKRRRPGA